MISFTTKISRLKKKNFVQRKKCSERKKCFGEREKEMCRTKRKEITLTGKIIKTQTKCVVGKQEKQRPKKSNQLRNQKK